MKRENLNQVQFADSAHGGAMSRFPNLVITVVGRKASKWLASRQEARGKRLASKQARGLLLASREAFAQKDKLQTYLIFVIS